METGSTVEPGSANWTATHRVPPAGLSAWDLPNASGRQLWVLAGGTRLQSVENSGVWMRVFLANGQAAWVDGRLLEPLTPPDPVAHPLTPREAVNWLAVVGSAIVVIGSAVLWMRSLGVAGTAWNLPVVYLFSYRDVASGLTVGPVLCLTLITLVPLVTRRPLARSVVIILGALAVNVALAGQVLALRASPGMTAGLGMAVAALGGATLLTAARPRSAERPQPGYVGWTPGNRYFLAAFAMAVLPGTAALLAAAATGAGPHHAEYAIPAFRDEAASRCASGSTTYCLSTVPAPAGTPSDRVSG